MLSRDEVAAEIAEIKAMAGTRAAGDRLGALGKKLVVGFVFSHEHYPAFCECQAFLAAHGKPVAADSPAALDGGEMSPELGADGLGRSCDAPACAAEAAPCVPCSSEIGADGLGRS